MPLYALKALPDLLKIPCSKPIGGEIWLPGSKSLTNRALTLAALARGRSKLEGMLLSEDTKLMQEAWQKLGVSLAHNQDGALEVEGCHGMIAPCSGDIYIGNAGTAARFLTACLCLGQGRYRLTGNARMQERPIADLINALRQQGCIVQDLRASCCPPLEIIGTGLRGGQVLVRGDKSSQYLSALMMVAPYAQSDTYLQIEGPLVSRSYIILTQGIMNKFGVRCDWLNEGTLFIPAQQSYEATHYHIEGDASSASYFFAMAAITGGHIKVRGLSKESQQGDIGLLDLLARMGCQITWQKDSVSVQGGALQAIDVDMNTMSDVAPTLAVVALFAAGESFIRNVGNMRIKECDRIKALATELSKVGATVREWDDGLAIQGGKSLHGAQLETYDDHRMAMALSLIGLRVDELYIKQPSCVAKTFPNYFDDFLSLVK